MWKARKLGNFFWKKFACFLAHCSHQEPYFSDILVSYESYDMWLYGKSEENWFLSGMGFFEGQFLQKIIEKWGKSNFKAAEVILMTWMRPWSLKQKDGIFIAEFFCFSDYGRIHVNKVTSAALKLDFPHFSVIFGRNCPSKNPIPLKNQIFSHLPHSHMS